MATSIDYTKKCNANYHHIFFIVPTCITFLALRFVGETSSALRSMQEIGLGDKAPERPYNTSSLGVPLTQYNFSGRAHHKHFAQAQFFRVKAAGRHNAFDKLTVLQFH